MKQRTRFFSLFRQLPNGKLTPRRVLNINEVTIGPGVSIGPGALIGGLDLFKILGRDLSFEVRAGITYIDGYFGQPVIF